MKKNNLKKRLLVLYRRLLLVCCLFFILLLISFNIGCQLLTETDNISNNDLNISSDEENVSGDAESVEGNADNGSTDIEESGEETGDSSEENGSSEKNNQTETEEQLDVSEGELTIKVYYADQQVKYLVGETRTVSSENKYVEALDELMKLPVDSSLIRLIPDTTKINSVKVEEGIARVDLSKNFVDDRATSDTEDIILVYSIVNTLTEFSGVDSVTFYIDGEKLNVLGMLDLQDLLYRRNDLIKD